jgi:hypothetical protein
MKYLAKPLNLLTTPDIPQAEVLRTFYLTSSQSFVLSWDPDHNSELINSIRSISCAHVLLNAGIFSSMSVPPSQFVQQI